MALYKKPRNVTYTQMAIFIDEHAYAEEHSEIIDNTIFEYLYHLIKMLAHKSNYFKESHYYDDFAVFMATSVFMRYRNPKQWLLDENGEPKLTKIKSSLNYIKQTIYPRKVDFEQQWYSQVLSPSNQKEDFIDYSTNYTFSDRLSESIEDLSMVEFDMCLSDIVKTAKAFISKLSYYTNKKEWRNIYLSCLLTFLNSITLSYRSTLRISNMKKDITNRPHTLEAIYTQEARDAVILYHLDPSMHDYIAVVTNEMKHAIAKDLSLTLHTYIPADTTFNASILADINSNNFIDYEE